MVSCALRSCSSSKRMDNKELTGVTFHRIMVPTPTFRPGAAKGMDVGPRQLPAVNGKKRSSTGVPEVAAKKDKSEMRDSTGFNERRDWRPQPPMMPVRSWNAKFWNQQPPMRFETEFLAAPEEATSTLPTGFVNTDEIKSMAIDGISRDIRFYGETAVAFIGWDNPRELTFQNDGVRKITFNDKESFVLGFNDDYKEVMVNGKLHLARLGAPSREIFIDRVPYECFFGSPGIQIQLDGVPTKVQLEGPPPPVNIGKIKRTDLVAGKINMYINAKVIVPVFLDGKVQKFVLDGQTSTLKFVDALKTVLINDVPFNIEYGGLPKPLVIQGKTYFLRFSVLPKGTHPGRLNILNMEGNGGAISAMDTIGLLEKPVGADSLDRNSKSSTFYPKIWQQQDTVNAIYPIENNHNSENGLLSPSPVPAPPININDLFQKLTAAGFLMSAAGQKKATEAQLEKPPVPESKIVPPVPVTSSQTIQPVEIKKTPVLSLKPVTFDRPESLKVRQSNLYSILYSGLQCSTCGMRFSPKDSKLYTQHLDWHFRQNRRKKINKNVATRRKWYYSVSDWMIHEELEDLEAREKNYFEKQAQDNGAKNSKVEIPSVLADPASADEYCQLCRDKFDQFFNEEAEEWHLKNAIRIVDKPYHPMCYEDYKSSPLSVTKEERMELPAEINNTLQKEDITEIIIIDDDNEELPVQPLSKHFLSVKNEESKLNPKPDAEESKPLKEYTGEDDDVILNEVAPITVIIDDDDEETPADPNASPLNSKTYREDDEFVQISGLVGLPNGKRVIMKTEPGDKDDIPTTSLIPDHLHRLTLEDNESTPKHDVLSSMDVKVGLSSCVSAKVSTGIRVNKISKPLPVVNTAKRNQLWTKQ